ncbi:uncharacterized protein Z520_04727 [Fonsecaea multimorphosa CBS 102226]|uniref:AB hydrolase-1 domain-containing protein n=1 Tax=Fonsecaea multimorphosa CBS 102226 TaxID=1442371 RepID=A0A0D2IQB3_9EURO|nr:uncharacterized protein Z520_04727 [Fonsecaea multimorphosa CBS 102226]KIX99151.1 hypothetical protein Z520_04727 [Fonsecaea multimorphosa CBS 102226]OAL26062.1 hypothetical protein AYO22_04476 [Fonsecaea multimorphosa]
MSSHDHPLCIHVNQDHGKETIVFLHALLASYTEYANVIPALNDYHLMLVNLPCHSPSHEIPPFELGSTSEVVAGLIEKKARNGRAHLVGLSMGGFIALEVAKCYPELVESVFVTGAVPLDGWRRWLAERPLMLYMEYGLASFIQYCPDWLYWQICSWLGIQRHDELRDETCQNFNFDLLRQGYAAILSFRVEDIKSIRARTLIVAASALDNVEITRRMGRLLRENNAESKAAVVTGLVHAWNLRFPELFAETIVAWAECRDLPKGLEELV